MRIVRVSRAFPRPCSLALMRLALAGTAWPVEVEGAEKVGQSPSVDAEALRSQPASEGVLGVSIGPKHP